MSTAEPLFTQEDLQIFERELGVRGLLLDVRRAWGAQADPEHRLKIRAGLAKAISHSKSTLDSITDSMTGSKSGSTTNSTLAPNAEVQSPPWLTDLSKLPSSTTHLCSISHGHHLGGFAACEKSGQISGLGFDLESLSRLAPKVIVRVSDEAERNLAPDARFLWPAKEATFKGTFGPHQPVAITEIVIGGWKPLTPLITAFTAVTSQHNLGRGLIKLDPRNDEVFALFAGI